MSLTYEVNQEELNRVLSDLATSDAGLLLFLVRCLHIQTRLIASLETDSTLDSSTRSTARGLLKECVRIAEELERIAQPNA